MFTIVILFHPETSLTRKFSLYADLDVIFKLVNSFQVSDEPIVSAYLWDQHNCLRLPLEAFDGQSMELPLQALKQQWEEALN